MAHMNMIMIMIIIIIMIEGGTEGRGNVWNSDVSTKGLKAMHEANVSTLEVEGPFGVTTRVLEMIPLWVFNLLTWISNGTNGTNGASQPASRSKIQFITIESAMVLACRFCVAPVGLRGGRQERLNRTGLRPGLCSCSYRHVVVDEVVTAILLIAV